MARRILIILLFVLNILAMSGCWDRTELEDLGVVNAVGIEHGSKERIRTVVQTLNTAAQSKTTGGRGVEFEKGYRNSVIEDTTFAGTINRMTVLTATKRNFSHNTLFIISEDFARKEGVRDLLDFLERDPQIRLDAWIIIGRGSLVNMLDVPGRISGSPGQRINDIIKFHNESFSYAPLKLEEFIRLLDSKSSQPYTAVVEIQPNASVPTDKGHGILNGNVPEPLNNIVMDGTALFKKDKMVGWLNDTESRGLLWLRGDARQGTLTFPMLEKTPKEITTYLLKSKIRLQPEIKEGQVYMTIKVEVESYLLDNQAGINPADPKEFGKAESAQGQEVKRQIKAALKKAQEQYQVDVFGFGEAVHRKYPHEWKQMEKDWPNLFPAVPVKIQVKSSIQHTSLTIGAPESAQR
ncbi:MAG: Ger(x)C family spore germination protein [Deltaproteobacteria bacterium]